MSIPRSSLWKKSLFLLAVSSRRDAVVAFCQTALVQVPTTPFTSKLLVASNGHYNLDISTAPLSHLIHLDDYNDDTSTSTSTSTDTDSNKQQPYQLVSPAADELPLLPNQRLICIGDVHGDYKALVEFLTIAAVYNPTDQQWIGGNTVLVQCGDVLDRGSQELKCFQLLTRLSQQAAPFGGHVILLWGNHEALNAGGMFHYTTGEEEYEQVLGTRIDQQLKTEKWRMQYAGNQPARWAAYEPGSGVLAHPLLANMKVAVKVGKTICVHAGLTTKHLEEYGGLRGMNAQARAWMKKCKP
jgi:Calcineurin-like phosphoesterase